MGLSFWSLSQSNQPMLHEAKDPLEATEAKEAMEDKGAADLEAAEVADLEVDLVEAAEVEAD